MMLLTSATAWADGVAFLPGIEKSDLLSEEAFEAVTFTLKKGDVTIATLKNNEYVEEDLDAGTYTITCNKTDADGIYVEYSNGSGLI